MLELFKQVPAQFRVRLYLLRIPTAPLLRFDLVALVDTSSLLLLGCCLCILRAAVACKSSIPALALLAVTLRSSLHNCSQARWARRGTALGSRPTAACAAATLRFGFVVSFRCGARLQVLWDYDRNGCSWPGGPSSPGRASAGNPACQHMGSSCETESIQWL